MKTSKKKIKMSELKTLDEVKQSFLEKGKEKGYISQDDLMAALDHFDLTEDEFDEIFNFFKDNGYIGRGVSGQSSYQFLLRFREDVIKLSPMLVVINAGTNDIAENTSPYNEEYTFGNIISMAELAKANRIKVILTSTLPAASFGWNPSIKDGADKIVSLNNRIKEYAQKNKIPYVDYYQAMVTGNNRALNPAYTKDGVHPNSEGYTIMESLIKKAIDKAL